VREGGDAGVGQWQHEDVSAACVESARIETQSAAGDNYLEKRQGISKAENDISRCEDA